MQPSLPGLTFPAIRQGSTWLRPIPGQPGLYASSHGRIWSVRGGGWRRLKPQRGGHQKWDSRGGYLRVRFRDYTKPAPKPQISRTVHALVATAWLGEKPSPEYEVDHINEDHLDNRPENLQWLHKDRNLAKRNGAPMTDEEWEDFL